MDYNLSTIELAAVAGFLAGLRPEPIITVSEWADLHRRLSPKAAAEAGPWLTSRVPYLREIMDALSTSNAIEEVIVMKGAQLGLTEAGNNWIGYIIHNAPGPTLMVMPTADTMKRNSEIRIDPMIEATPVLQEKIKPARSRDSGNKMMQKDFPGGVLMMAGANSAAGLRSMPVRFLFLDEIDAYPANLDKEGSPIDLAEARTRTFRQRKIYKISTPKIKGSSAIENEFEDTDQRYYFVPCPECGAYQTLVWEQIRWDKEASKSKRDATVFYECVHCEAQIPERKKQLMLELGEWRATKPDNASPIRVGYHINSFYSPFYTWAQIVNLWLKSEKVQEKLIAFINTILGESFVEAGDAPDWEALYNRREMYDGETVVPNGVGIITAGADIQKDRIEVEAVGWGEDNESWSLGYYVLVGNTDLPEVWEKLGEWLDTKFTREDGLEMPVRSMAVDTGYLAQAVYSFAAKYPADRVMPIKGQDAQRVAISAPQAVQRKLNGKRRGSSRLFNIGVTILKSELYGWLRRERRSDGTLPPGFAHFPMKYDQHYFKMLTAEKYVLTTNNKGFGKWEWVKTQERNEALDVRVYARAAAMIIGISTLTAEDWAAMCPARQVVVPALAEELVTGAEIVAAQAPEPKPAPVAPAPAPKPASPPKPRAPVSKRGSIWGNRN